MSWCCVFLHKDVIHYTKHQQAAAMTSGYNMHSRVLVAQSVKGSAEPQSKEECYVCVGRLQGNTPVKIKESAAGAHHIL